MLPKPYRFSTGRAHRLWAALSLGLRSYCCDWNVRQTSAAQTQRLFSTIKKKQITPVSFSLLLIILESLV